MAEYDYFKAVLEADRVPVVLCNLDHEIVYMNPAAADHYSAQGGYTLIGSSLLDCHTPRAREIIEKTLTWFAESPDNNIIYEFRNDAENKDVYTVALRDDNKKLIGYYEKHESRNRETRSLYDYK